MAPLARACVAEPGIGDLARDGWLGAAGKLSQVSSEFVAIAPKRRKPFVFGTGNGGRVVEIVVQAVGVSGENRAGFVGLVADGEHVIEFLIPEFVERF